MEKFFNNLGELFGKSGVSFPSSFQPSTPSFSWPTFIGGVVSALLATWVF